MTPVPAGAATLRRAGTHTHGRWLWVPGLATMARPGRQVAAKKNSGDCFRKAARVNERMSG
jgi:hypothetical protein